MTEYLFSLIVTVYNKERYLRRCLESLATHDVAHEVINVDDSSTDSSSKRCIPCVLIAQDTVSGA
ncbi:MAG: hypothetical protein CBC79_02750 [Gammaproteobacteria bacterium TMED119]|nr:MAG: hypothetical protein CBC79_02750 [Gammaproteobacteria bacterium TMED119]|tara:strand:+ start:1352 stop:1546 length:195 start_codon:yes stop_codon:yes gene_type:complete